MLYMQIYLKSELDLLCFICFYFEMFYCPILWDLDLYAYWIEKAKDN